MAWKKEKQLEHYHRVQKKNPTYVAKKREYAAARRAANPRTSAASWVIQVLPNVKHRAKAAGLPFDLTVADVYVPEYCPVLGVRLVFGRACMDSASLDRLQPALGYVKGNVAVISKRANMMKLNASAAEVRLLLAWMEREGLS